MVVIVAYLIPGAFYNVTPRGNEEEMIWLSMCIRNSAEESNKEMKAAILYNKFFDHDGREQLIGGVETYLLNLSKLCQEMEMETTIYQWSNYPFEKIVDGLSVKGIPVFHLPAKKKRQAIFQAVSAEIDMDKDILIFGADHVSVPTKNLRHISIQQVSDGLLCLSL